jgi:hypothetical protein
MVRGVTQVTIKFTALQSLFSVDYRKNFCRLSKKEIDNNYQ